MTKKPLKKSDRTALYIAIAKAFAAVAKACAIIFEWINKGGGGGLF